MANLDSDQLDDHTYEQLTDFIYRKSGIVIKKNRKTMIANRLRGRIKTLGLHGFDEYWRFIKQEKEPSEFYHFLDAVSTNETYFQRSPGHYKILKEYIIPGLLETGKKEFLFWSCGTSTGEEAYDLAMIAHEAEQNHNATFRVVGTDLSQKALAHARQGQYADRRIKNLTCSQIERYFDIVPSGKSLIPFAHETLQVKDFLKKKVRFDYHNLLNDVYIANVDLIFCRNVMIYFNSVMQQAMIDRFADSMNFGGYLILGHSESLQRFETSLETIRLSNATIYRKSEHLTL